MTLARRLYGSLRLEPATSEDVEADPSASPQALATTPSAARPATSRRVRVIMNGLLHCLEVCLEYVEG